MRFMGTYFEIENGKESLKILKLDLSTMLKWISNLYVVSNKVDFCNSTFKSQWISLQHPKEMYSDEIFASGMQIC